jgi:hypothetical protein
LNAFDCEFIAACGVSLRAGGGSLVFQKLVELRFLAVSVSVELSLARLFNRFRSVLRIFFVYVCVDELTVAIGP